MTPVHVDKCLADDQSQPDEQGHRLTGPKVFQPLYGIDKCLLQNVVGIDAPLQTTIQAKVNHPPQAVPMLREHLGEDFGVSGEDALEPWIFVLLRRCIHSGLLFP